MGWSWVAVLSPLVFYSHFCYFLTAEHMLLISSMDDTGNKNVEIVLNMFQMLVSNKVGCTLRFPLQYSY